MGRSRSESFSRPAGMGEGARRAAHPFSHGGEHRIGGLTLFDSYHCSRYNTNTGVLTPEMFRAVFARARAYLDSR